MLSLVIGSSPVVGSSYRYAARAADDRAREADALSHAAGEIRGHLSLLAAEFHHVERLRDPGVNFLRIAHPQFAQRKCEVPLDAHRVE